MKLTKTYKVTYFDKLMDVACVETYHNFVNQSSLLDIIWNNIVVRGYSFCVRCETEDSIYTTVVNDLIIQRLTNPELFE